MTYGNEFLRWFSEEAVRIAGRFGTNPEGTGRMIVSRHPVGPCHLITPWNFPLAMATRKIGPALAAGCTAVVKPAELTPLTTLLLMSVLAEAGLPAGVVNVVTTTDPGAVSGTIIADPRLRKLSFTGSTPVGQRLLGQAAKGVLRTSMELGGNAPFLVFADADVDAAVDGAMLAKFRNVGEACTAANRFIVAAEVADEFTAKVTARVEAMRVGRGTEDGVQIGPLINQAARDKADGARRRRGRARRRGRRRRPLDRRPRHLLRAHRRLGRTPRQPHPARGDLRAGARRRDVRRRGGGRTAWRTTPSTGWSRYAYTRDLARGMRLVDALQTGMVGLNTGVVSNAAAPFGGVKQSGLGREGGARGPQRVPGHEVHARPRPLGLSATGLTTGNLPVGKLLGRSRKVVGLGAFEGRRKQSWSDHVPDEVGGR